MYCTGCGRALDDGGGPSRVSSRKVLYVVIGAFVCVGLLALQLRRASDTPVDTVSAADIAGRGMSATDITTLWRSVVTLVSLDADGRLLSRGSGFIIDGKGTVATAWTLIEHAARVHGVTHDGAGHVVTRLLNVDREQDVALVCLGTSSTPLGVPAVLGEDSVVLPGAAILTIAAPGAWQHTVSEGGVAAIRDLKHRRLLELTAPISPHVQGAPVLTPMGEVIAVVVGHANGERRSLAVPASVIRRLAFELNTPASIILPPWPVRR